MPPEEVAELKAFFEGDFINLLRMSAAVLMIVCVPLLLLPNWLWALYRYHREQTWVCDWKKDPAYIPPPLRVGCSYKKLNGMIASLPTDEWRDKSRGVLDRLLAEQNNKFYMFQLRQFVEILGSEFDISSAYVTERIFNIKRKAEH